MLQIVLWKWQADGKSTRAYDPDHVNIMCAMLRRNLHGMPHRILCVTDRPAGIFECETHHLWTDHWELANASGPHLPSCYRRLKLYDRATQEDMGIEKGDRILSLDLDALICADIRALMLTQGEYVGWELRGQTKARVFNGSFQMFTARTLQDIWSEFNDDPRKAITAAGQAGFKGSDQAWLSYKLINRETSVGLKWPDVSSYPLQNRVQGILRRDNRIIFFHGNTKPWDDAARQATPWIDRYWRS
jgi:hypothetical protein